MLPTIAVGAEVATSALIGEPERGAVVVFRAPERPEQQFVKRIIGLPGDTISANGTEILLNGTALPRCRVGPWNSAEAGGEARDGDLWLERLDGRMWLVFHASGGEVGPAGPWKVAPGEVFVLGDNREKSHDSRVWYGGKGGGVPLTLIVGVVAYPAAPALPKGAEALGPALEACEAPLPH
jgi:signal peptidase I